MNTDQSREAFEAWWLREHPDMPNYFKEWAWAGWLAASPATVAGAARERPHGLVNELEREIIRLNKEVHDWQRELNMYRDAWCREIGGFIRRKSWEIDGFVLRTRDALKEAEERGRAALLTGLRGLREALSGATVDLNSLCEAISRIRWAHGTDKLDAAIFEAVRIQRIVDAGKPQERLAALDTLVRTVEDR